MKTQPEPGSIVWHAIIAARSTPKWGRQTALQYIQRNKVPHKLYTLARVLANAERTL